MKNFMASLSMEYVSSGQTFRPMNQCESMGSMYLSTNMAK
jgi:hypothetical protein